MRHDREMWDVLLECDLAILRLFLHGAAWRRLRRMEASEAIRARQAPRWERGSLGMSGPTCSWDKTRSVFCGLSRDGRLYIFFDEPFALQMGNGVLWWV